MWAGLSVVDPASCPGLGEVALDLSDEEARRRGTQKSVLERKAPPTFDVVIEIQDRQRMAYRRAIEDYRDSQALHAAVCDFPELIDLQHGGRPQV